MSYQKPSITISTLDLERLESLLSKLPNNTPGKDALQAELDRAEVLEPNEMPANVVTMNSIIRFSLQANGKQQTLHLVYPKDADGNLEKISVLAPVGIALLGLREGDIMQLPSATGNAVTVQVESIIYQPESAGQLHR